MTTRQDIGMVVALACLTEDRTPQEQRALLAVALRLDSALGNWAASNNRERAAPCFVARALEGQTIGLTGAQRIKYGRLCAKWTPCPNCGQPVGSHEPDHCTTEISTPRPPASSGDNAVSEQGADLDVARDVVVTA